jgi:hypothetical protein
VVVAESLPDPFFAFVPAFFELAIRHWAVGWPFSSSLARTRALKVLCAD